VARSPASETTRKLRGPIARLGADFRNKKTKATKTDETRTLPIEPHLLPLPEARQSRVA
jgi:hypothetical protein